MKYSRGAFAFKLVPQNVLVTPITKIPISGKCIQKNQIKRIPFKAETLNKFKFIWSHVLGFSRIVTDGFIHTFSSDPMAL